MEEIRKIEIAKNTSKSYENVTDKTTSIEQIETVLNDKYTSDYIVCFLRFVISGNLRRNEELFQYFISEGMTVPEFCLKDVEPMGIECDQIQIVALSNEFANWINRGILIENLDCSDIESVNHVKLPEDKEPFLYLLYRPGHYDILY